MAINALDISVVVVYFLAIAAVGMWAIYRANRGNTKGYFLAGRDMPWWAVGASLFASNIGSEHFTGLAGTGVVSGIAYASYEFNAIWVLLLLGWIFLPVYLASGVYTMPEYMKRRFGGKRIRIFLAAISMFGYVFTKISVSLLAGATFIQQVFKWNIYISIFLLLAITALFTIAGGLAAVIYTDTAQCFIMLIGAFTLMVCSLWEIGGWRRLDELYGLSVAVDATDECGMPRTDAWHLFRDPINGDLPWPTIFTGMVITSVWYWCTDQVIVQRTLAAKDLTNGKGGIIMAGWLKLSPMFLIIIPGMISRVLYPDEVGCATPESCKAFCGSESGCSNAAYAKLVVGVLPQGVRGLMLAVMLSALMSSLTSVFNSASTVFTIDLYKMCRNNASEAELMLVGRLFVAVLIAVSVAWVPIVQESQSGVLMDYLQNVQSAMGAPIAAVFVLGVVWRRTNEPGAVAGLAVGVVIGALYFVLTTLVFTAPACGNPDTRPTFFQYFHYLYFAVFSFLLCSIITVIVSLLTDPIPEQNLYRLTFSTRHSPFIRTDLDCSDDEAEQEPQLADIHSAYRAEFGYDSHSGARAQLRKTSHPPPPHSVPDEPQGARRDQHDSTREEEPPKRGNRFIVFVKSFCGETTSGDEEAARLERKRIREVGNDVHEKTVYARIANVNAFLIFCATVFIFSFFH